MAMGFMSAGHTVIGCGRTALADSESLQSWQAPHRYDCLDVTDERAVEGWAKSVLSGGPIDLLVNNAALVNTNNSLWEVDSAEFSRVIDVNIKGVFHVIKHFAPAMIGRASGIIVNFSSGWGRGTAPEVAPYCATKWAIEGLTQSLAQELPKGMAAIPLNPGVIDTDMLRSCFGAAAATYPSPRSWAKRAVPFLLALGPSHNGRPLSVPV
jgi:NAD(P)-dependent dehydrogenase (short-subunit alcohol dehydrogenase family)